MTKELEIRCFCQHEPILAVGGRDSENGLPFIHIKSVGRGRLNVEAIITEGTVHLRCRVCMRWHTVRIVKQKIESKPERLPDSIAV